MRLLHGLRETIIRGAGLILFTLILSLVAPAAAQQPLMGIEDVKPGMTGIGKTVIQGTKIEDFTVEVLSVLKQKGPAGDKIMVRVGGDVIDKTGGIAAGFSGSPVYIDGKLIGAISYGWSMTDRRIGLVTPIYDMLQMAKLNASGEDDEPRTGADPAGPPAVSTPIMVSGLGQRALEKLTEQLAPYNLTPVLSGAAAGMENEKVALEPGSAAGVQLMRGDIDMTAIGTVTYREGDNILAFGHPFLKRGGVGYFLTSAYIHQTIPSLETSFKLGAALDLVGTVNQDRNEGIAGVVGRYPHNIPLRMHVKDLDTGRENNLFVQVIQDELLSPALVTTAAMQAIEQTIDRTGLGTSWVKIEVMGRNLPDNMLVKENMFFHPTDIGSGSLGELLEGLALVLTNPFNAVEIMDVKVDVAIEQSIQTAKIEEVHTKTAVAKPGQTIPIFVSLKPYRGDAIQETLNFTVPAYQAPGPMAVTVRGGGSVPVLQKLLTQLGAQEIQTEQPKKLETYLRDFVQRDRNNELVAEITPMIMENDPGVMFGGEIPLTKAPNQKVAMPAKPPVAKAGAMAAGKEKAKLSTDYIVDGSAVVYINVAGKTPGAKDEE